MRRLFFKLSEYRVPSPAPLEYTQRKRYARRGFGISQHAHCWFTLEAMDFSSQRLIKLSEAQDAIPTRDGKLYADQFHHGSLTVEIYAPKGTDLQQPHTRDELYIVVAGSGWFFCEGQRVQFSPGDALFAAAGEVHRFEDFNDDLLVWVVFYGPEGGERAR
jgi:mannose-6-phosphate isomerase-like protein (cupin superfamily)